MTYVDGFVLPVPENRLEDYRKMAENAGKIWMEHGALAFKECCIEDGNPTAPEDMPEMKMVPFSDLARLKDGETVIFSFIVFKSREHRDEVNAKVMADPRMKDSCPGQNPDLDMPFDVNRMSYGGFKTIVDF